MKKTNIRELLRQQRRERKENRLETITGYLDFGYEAARTIWEICMTQLLLFGVLALYFIERNELSEMQKDFNSIQVQQSIWLLVFSIFICKLLFDSVLYRKIAAPVTASLIWCMVTGTFVYHGISIFTMSKILGVGFGAWMIKYILIFIMDLAELPSRNIVRCYNTDGKPGTGGIRLEVEESDRR